MTLSINTKSPVNVSAWKFEMDGVPGYILNVSGTVAFLDEKQADEVGRYLLFNDPGENTQPTEVQPEEGVEEPPVF